MLCPHLTKFGIFVPTPTDSHFHASNYVIVLPTFSRNFPILGQRKNRFENVIVRIIRPKRCCVWKTRSTKKTNRKAMFLFYRRFAISSSNRFFCPTRFIFPILDLDHPILCQKSVVEGINPRYCRCHHCRNFWNG